MMTKVKSILINLLHDERAQVLPLMAFLMIGFFGCVGFVVDTGDVYYSYHQLLASTNAAALAGAQGLTTSGAQAVSNAKLYSSGAGGYNAYPNLNITGVQVNYGCATGSVATNVPCVYTKGSGSTKANAIQVIQTATVRTYFMAIFGTSSVKLTAQASALMRGVPSSYNIALIVDTTGSMNGTDDDCGSGVTELQCAFNGIQIFLADIAPCGLETCQGTSNNTNNYSNASDRVALFTFPNQQTGVINNDYNCSALPADELVPQSGQTITNYKNAVPYVFPAIGGTLGTVPYKYTSTGYNPTTTTYPVTYEVTDGLGDANGFMTNYQQDGSDSLNSGSDMVMALGGGASGCASMQSPYIDGTYYAGVIYQAQEALAAEQAAYPGTQNVMIILGDGDSNVSKSYVSSFNSAIVSSSQTNSGYLLANQSGLDAASNNYYPSLVDDCGQAILAAAYAKAKGTQIYTVAYGSPSGGANTSDDGCSTDTTTGVNLATENITGTSTNLSGSSKDISPCQTLRDMATSDSYFFSDYLQSGADAGCKANTNLDYTSLAEIFRIIANGLQHSRLVPNTSASFTPAT